jgi:hypothetical protein
VTPRTDRAVFVPGRRRMAALATATFMIGGFGLTGCSVISAVSKVAHTVSGNRATIKLFTQKLNSGKGTTFEATYVTTGASPTTVVYAVKPPKGLAFNDTQTGANSSGGTDLIVNTSGEYSCSPPSGSIGWTCQKLPKATAIVRNQILDFYTPSHWVVFLRDFALAAGFAGDKVFSSTMTVNGFSMNCVNFRASGVNGTSTICTTAQGILGYVKVASNSTNFEIKSYTTSPSPSLFALPPGAKVTNLQTGN